MSGEIHGPISLIRNTHDSINHFIEKTRLKNKRPYLICNNCAGGIMYHWLGLQFTVPFINCSMENKDYVTALENFQEFMNFDIYEDTEMSSKRGFPVGVGACDTRILFFHYKTFADAKGKWDERKSRMQRVLLPDGKYYYRTDNLAIMLTWGGAERAILERFDRLPFKYKVAFTNKLEDLDIKSCFYIKGFNPEIGLWRPLDKKFAIRRLINQFDWVDFLNRSGQYEYKHRGFFR